MNIGEKYYCSRCMREIDREGICPHCGYDPAASVAGSQLEEGTLLQSGRYELGTVIGQGGFGITYSAWDQVLDIPVAIKEYYPDCYCQRDISETDTVFTKPDCSGYYHLGLQTFIREARILAMLQNIPTVVKVYDCFEKNNTAYIVMEFVRGETLQHYCQKHHPKEQELLKMLRNTIDDLILVHKAGVLHRDISPSNLLVQENGTVKLIDFGAAANLAIAEEKNPSLNRSFAAPEQYDANGEQGFWTDVYGLAATLYTLFTGEMIPDAPSRLEKDCLKKPRRVGAKISHRLSSAIFRGLRIDPRKRIQSMEEFRAELYHLPLPLQTRRQKALFTLKIVMIYFSLEVIMLGIVYCRDNHLPQQLGMTVKAILRQDAQVGYELATNYKLGILGEKKFPKDLDKAIYWYQWAIERGSVEAAVDYGYELEYGDPFEQNIPQAIAYYQMGVDAEDPIALNNLAIHYLNGDYLEKNVSLAMQYLRKAAEAGVPLAMTNLGNIYREGVDVEMDGKKAVSYYRMAAEKDDPRGLLYLGICYGDGIGVEQDSAQFLQYAYRSAFLGYDEAMFCLGECYRNGALGYTDYKEAMAWYDAAMENMYGGGYYGAAILYRDGLGVAVDPEKASSYMLSALMLGYEPAKEECDQMNATHYGVFGEDTKDG